MACASDPPRNTTEAGRLQLREQIAEIEGSAAYSAVLPFGLEAIDRHLPGGGLSNGALHEIAGSAQLADNAAATVFLAGILARTGGPVLWCFRWRHLFAPAGIRTKTWTTRRYFMYSHADRIRAVELYIQLGKRVNATIGQLGYPTKKR